MIATCPACGKRYRLADDAVPAAGRSVRCAACGHGWTAHPFGQVPPEPAAPPDLAVPAAPADLAVPAGFAAAPPATPAPAPVPAALSDTRPAPPPPPAPVAAPDARPVAPPSPPPLRHAEIADVIAPPRRRHIGWIAAVIALLAVAALAVVEFAPAATFDPPRLGLPAATLPLADLGSLALPDVTLPEVTLPDRGALDLAQVPLVGPALARLTAATPASPLRVTASGERRRLPNGTWLLTVTGTVANPTAAPVALAGIDAALADRAGNVAFRWRVPPPASLIPAHASAGFESVAANFPPAATVLRLTPR